MDDEYVRITFPVLWRDHDLLNAGNGCVLTSTDCNGVPTRRCSRSPATVYSICEASRLNVYQAWWVGTASEEGANAILEAQLLSGRTFAEVGRRLQLHSRTDEWYTLLLFDIRSKLHALDWIVSATGLNVLRYGKPAKAVKLSTPRRHGGSSSRTSPTTAVQMHSTPHWSPIL